MADSNFDAKFAVCGGGEGANVLPAHAVCSLN